MRRGNVGSLSEASVWTDAVDHRGAIRSRTMIVTRIDQPPCAFSRNANRLDNARNHSVPKRSDRRACLTLHLRVFDQQHRQQRDGTPPIVDHFVALWIFAADQRPPRALMADFRHILFVERANNALIRVWDLDHQFLLARIKSMYWIDIEMV